MIQARLCGQNHVLFVHVCVSLNEKATQDPGWFCPMHSPPVPYILPFTIFLF